MKIIFTILMAGLLSFQLACGQPETEPSKIAVNEQNHNPVIESIISPRDAFSNMDVELACVASDADGDNLSYKWSAEAGDIKSEGENALWMPPGKMGTYAIALAVTDGKGGEAKETINIRVLTNADGTATPTVEIKLNLGDSQTVIVDKQRARIWTTTDIICIAGDASGIPLSYTWTASEGKITGKGVQEGNAERISWTAPGLAGDNIVHITVTDNQGRQATGQVNIKVYCCGN